MCLHEHMYIVPGWSLYAYICFACFCRYFDFSHLAGLLSLYGINEDGMEGILAGLGSSNAEKVACSNVLTFAWKKHRASHIVQAQKSSAQPAGRGLAACTSASTAGFSLEIDTDSEDDDAFLSRLSDRPTTAALPDGFCPGTGKPVMANTETRVTPSDGVENTLDSKGSCLTPISEKPSVEELHSPLDFFRTYRRLVDTCSECKT